MKKIITPIIIFGMFFAGTQFSYAQTQAELDAEYKNLLMQLLEKLQMQLAQEQGALTQLILQDDTLCGFAYDGSTETADIQQALQNQGYAITKVDGIAGPETRSAVTAFQVDNELESTGNIDSTLRERLMKNSLMCVGDAGVSQSPKENSEQEISEVSEIEDESKALSELCSLAYNGSTETADIQQALQNQGYAITKVDGIAGPETRSAVTAFQADNGISADGEINTDLRIMLSRQSVSCSAIDSDNQEQELITETSIQGPVLPNVTTSEVVTTGGLFNSKEIVTEVRSTIASIPDDTAVFTYRLIIESEADQEIYIPTNHSNAFAINIFDTNGRSIETLSFNSIVSSGSITQSARGENYFKLTDGDTVSLRSSLQPGAGDYYAELSRITYTNDDVSQVAVPSMVNYGFDADAWKTSTISLQN